MITLVIDNHVDNYLKEILAFVYYDSFVNNRPKNRLIQKFSKFLYYGSIVNNRPKNRVM